MKKVSRLTTAVGAFTLGIGLLGTSFALAAPPAAPDAPNVPAKVDTEKAVSFTIVKYSGPEVETGHRPDAGKNKPLQGIKFTVTRIDYNGSGTAPNIGTGAWWKWAYSQKADGTFNDAEKTSHSFELTTDTNGQACLSSSTGMATTAKVTDKVKAGTTCVRNAEVKQGLYLVEETGTSAGGKNYRGALPFFITLPLAEGTDTSAATWNYDPIIEPKNQEFSLEKKLTDAGADKGVYTVSSSIPSSGLVAEGVKTYDAKYPFGIEDIYPTALEPIANDVKVFVKGSTQAKLELTKETDFKASAKALGEQKVDTDIWKNAVADGNTLAVYFTTEGAQKLATAVKADPTAKVYFNLPFSIKDQTAKITNEVVPHDPNSKKKPSNDRKITNDDGQFIDLKFTKVDAEDAGSKLQGAVFNFYKCSVDEKGNLTAVGKALPGFAQAGNYTDSANKAVYDFTTAASTGEVTAHHVLNAAKISTSDSDGVPTSAGKYVMCAVEKTAPAGYKKNPYPIKVETSSAADGTEVSETVTNTKTTFFDRLPKTGAAGIILLLVLGGSMVVAGVAMRRRNSEEA